MTSTGTSIKHPGSIRDAGAILRALSPARAATLVLVRGGDFSQRDIADHLDRTPPAISNYVERLGSLPQPLVKKEGHDHWATDEGKQVVSAIFDFGSCVDTDLRSGWRDGVDWMERYADCMTPLYEFRSNSPFLILHALGTGTTTLAEVVATVKRWSEGSITRSQIISRLRRVEDTSLAEVEDESVILTDKGKEQYRLLDHIAQIFVETSMPENDAIYAAYRAESDAVLRLPSSLTVDELESIVSEFKDENGGESALELVQTRTRPRLKD